MTYYDYSLLATDRVLKTSGQGMNFTVRVNGQIVTDSVELSN